MQCLRCLHLPGSLLGLTCRLPVSACHWVFLWVYLALGATCWNSACHLHHSWEVLHCTCLKEGLEFSLRFLPGCHHCCLPAYSCSASCLTGIFLPTEFCLLDSSLLHFPACLHSLSSMHCLNNRFTGVLGYRLYTCTPASSCVFLHSLPTTRFWVPPVESPAPALGFCHSGSLPYRHLPGFSACSPAGGMPASLGGCLPAPAHSTMHLGI